MQTTYGFRCVVRGSDKDGRRVRRVRTLQAMDYESAWIGFADVHAEMARGLRDTSANVLPPSGWKVDGTLSRGHALADA